MKDTLKLTIRIIYDASKWGSLDDDCHSDVVGVIQKDLTALHVVHPPAKNIQVIGPGRVEFFWNTEEGSTLHRQLERKLNPTSPYAITRTDPGLLGERSIIAIEYDQKREMPGITPHNQPPPPYHANKIWVRDKKTETKSIRDFHAEAENLLENVKREFEDPVLSFNPPGLTYHARDVPYTGPMTRVKEESPTRNPFSNSSYYDGQHGQTLIQNLATPRKTSLQSPLTVNSSTPSLTNRSDSLPRADTHDVAMDYSGGSMSRLDESDGEGEFQRESSSMSIASSTGWKIPTPPPPPPAFDASVEETKIIVNETEKVAEMIIDEDMDIAMTPPLRETPHLDSPPPFRPRSLLKNNFAPPPPPRDIPPPLPPLTEINNATNPRTPTSPSNVLPPSRPRFKVAFPSSNRSNSGVSQDSEGVGRLPVRVQAQGDAQNASGDVSRLMRELEVVRKEMKDGVEREKRILNELRGLGAGDDVVKDLEKVAGIGVDTLMSSSGNGNDCDALYVATKARLRMVEEQIEAERRRRRELEEVLKDVERECRAPFVVPALLDAFITVSQLTSKACEGVQVQRAG